MLQSKNSTEMDLNEISILKISKPTPLPNPKELKITNPSIFLPQFHLQTLEENEGFCDYSLQLVL